MQQCSNGWICIAHYQTITFTLVHVKLFYRIASYRTYNYVYASLAKPLQVIELN